MPTVHPTIELKDKLVSFYQRISAAAAVAFYVFLLAPSVIVMIVSFGATDSIRFPPRALSLDLYQAFFSDPNWTVPLLQSVKIAVLSSVISVVLAVPASYGLARFNFRFKGTLTAVVLSPLLIPSIILGLGLYLYFTVLGITGTNTALLAGHVVYSTPFVMIVIGAGVVKLDPNLEFAATLMGASRRKMFLTVVLPQLLPSIVAGWLFSFLISFDEVVLSWFLVGPSTTTLPVKMFSSIQWEISPVIAAVATVLTLLSLMICLPAAFLQRSASGDIVR
ncbi:MAG: ABC transporter permease [Mesorhizobium sp.]|nr:MAG: ABC transporter permease [Mesorhizobium sp.]